jgi:ketosteroid isomerase-like protein
MRRGASRSSIQWHREQGGRVSDENVATLKQAYEAFARGDLAAVVATLDPNVLWEGVGDLVPAGARHRGVDQVVHQVLETLPDAYERFEAAPEEFIDAGECIIALGTFTVRPEGADRTVSTPFAQVAEFDDGRMARVRWFTDTAEWLYAMPESPSGSAHEG